MSKQKRLSKEYQRKLQGYEKKPLFTFAEINESLRQEYMKSLKEMLNRDVMGVFETDRMKKEMMIDDYMKIAHPVRYKWVKRFKASRFRLIRVKAAKWLMRSFRTEEDNLPDRTRIFRLCKGDTILREIRFVPQTIEFRRYDAWERPDTITGKVQVASDQYPKNMQGYWKSEDGTINCRDTLCSHGFDKNDGRGCAECDLDDYMQAYSEEGKPEWKGHWEEGDDDSLPKNGERKFPQR